MPTIQLQTDDSLDMALRRFRRACEKAGIPQKVRQIQYYIKRSELRKMAKLAAIKRWRKKVAKSKNSDSGRGDRGGKR